MDPFVYQRAKLCGAQVTRCKWVFVASQPNASGLGERIEIWGARWVGAMGAREELQ